MAVKRPRGVYRARRPEGIENDVWVTDDTVDMFITESRYIYRGYEPPIETLPWEEPDGREPQG